MGCARGPGHFTTVAAPRLSPLAGTDPARAQCLNVRHALPDPMLPAAYHLIIEEHQAMATVLRALRQSIDHARTQPPAFAALRAMLVYLDEMPARIHHATESELLFPLIRVRCPALAPVLDRLEAEHARGEGMVRELERGLNAWEVMGQGRRETFELQARAYVQTYLGHMEVEESYVLPVAQDYLSAGDWQALEVALRRQRGAAAPVQGHEALLERILAQRLAS